MSLPRVIADGPLAPAVQACLAERVEFLPWTTFDDPQPPSVDGVYTYGHLRVDGSMLDHVGPVKVISNYGVGVDHIELADAQARGIPVGNTPDVLNGATADMGFALLMATGRRLVEGDRFARSDGFTAYDPGYMLGREIHGATLGILGMGRIGSELARRAQGFDMQVIYHNRRRVQSPPPSVVTRYVSFDDLLRTADFLVVCVPLNDATRGLIGASELAAMKPTACLINIARGAIVDTDALTKALQERTIYAAGLDVTDPEPLPREHKLLQLPNVLITPHLGSATDQTRQRMAEVSAANLLAGLRGEPLMHRVA